jgi:hypothetical protein
MTYIEYLSLLRGLLFLWVAGTSFSISQLYKDGYNISKRESGIIKSLINILLWISVMFVHLALTAFSLVLAPHAHPFLTTSLIATVFPVGILLTRFRQESTKRQNPDK